MLKTAMIRARTEEHLKSEVEDIFEQLGMTSTEAINIFYRQVKLRRGLPFSVEIPNKETTAALRKSREGMELNSYDSLAAFVKKMSK
jgi:DNA-damage-inducible protein J